MKPNALFIFLAFTAAASAYDAAIPYFSRSRPVSVPASASQSYIVVDSDIWKYSRPDLADIRLYDGQSQVPYALVKESGGSSTKEVQAKMLNLGNVGGHTEFDLDVSSLAEYDRVRLRLSAENFINNAQVQGRRSLKDFSGTNLGGSTLYDFTNEALGSNLTVKFTTSSFPYLHVRLAPGIRPDQVKGAFLSNFSETKAFWESAGKCVPVAGVSKQTIFDCEIDQRVPLARVAFEMNDSSASLGQPNFSRTVTLFDNRGREIQIGTISRILIKRAGQTVSN